MEDAYSILERVRAKKPLVHHITNWVTIYDCANVVRAFGALPVMAHAKEEAADMAGIASSLVLNIGTLTPSLIDSMIVAGKQADARGIPIILDAVGAGATPLRTNETKRLMSELRIDVLKGNAGEIATVAGVSAEVRGVESISAGGEPSEIAKRVAMESKCTVAITGREDIVSNGKDTYGVKNGHALMGTVVGTGCMAASVIGAFCAVEKDYAKASACALGCFGLAGELAAMKAGGPGTFKALFYDEIFALGEEKIKAGLKVERK